jgi:hypothetical protein
MKINLQDSTHSPFNKQYSGTITHFCQECEANGAHSLIERVNASVSATQDQTSVTVLLQCHLCQAFTLTDIPADAPSENR